MSPGADTGKVRAQFRDGVLEVTVPAPAPKQQTERRQVRVESGTSTGEAKPGKAA